MRGVTFVFGVMLFLSSLTAQEQVRNIPQNQYKFKHLTIDQGLSNNQVRTVCQDSKGFIWFGTENGLNKFDGQSFIYYWHDLNDSNSVSANVINCIFLDSKDRLWIAHSDGIDYYNADLNNFVRFSQANIKEPTSQIVAITEDKEGNFWFSGYHGLYKYNLETEELKYFSNNPDNPKGLPPDGVNRLLVDKDGDLWFSVYNNGVYVMDREHKIKTHYKFDPKNDSTISGSRIEEIYEDNEGNIWLGTYNNGLNLFLPESSSFKRYIPDAENSYSSRVRVMFEDLKGDLFIGTRAGLYIYNKTTDKFILYANEEHNFSKLSQNSILDAIIDRSGTLWIGTFSGGVNYTNLNNKDFIHYIAGKDNNHYLSGSNIYALTEDPEGNLWIGGDNGLNYLDRTTHTFKYFLNDPNDTYSLSYNDLKTLAWDDTGNLWIGTNKGGLNYLDVKTRKFLSYRHNPDNPGSITGDKVYNLLYDSNKNLWVISSINNDMATLSLDVLPHNKNEFTRFNKQVYFGLVEDKFGNICIGGIRGFWIYTPKDSMFSFVANEDMIRTVNTLSIDSENKLWIGSSNGLVRYDFEDESFIHFSESTGYPIAEVFGILEDDRKNLWVSTIAGLLKLNNVVSDTSNIQVRIYDQYDGMQSKQFNFNAYYKCRSGEMIFGGVNGINTFFPDDIVENTTPADVILTGFEIFNNPVPIGKKIDGRVVLEKSISVADKITLGPKQNVFTLEFASLQNSNPEKYTFRFKLEGFDRDWQYRKARNNMVTYTNLAAGEYVFMVTAANKDGYWNENPVELRIEVYPPFWKTWWFRITGSLVFIGIILGGYYIRLRSIRNQNVVLEQKVKSRTQEVREKNNMLEEANLLLHEKQEEILSQNEELSKHRNNLESLVNERTSELKAALQKAEESDALKSAFLANMSHEVRTPMNAIVGFANLIEDSETTKEERVGYVQIIQSNSNSLLKIIDGILDLSIIESNQFKINKSVFELNMTLDHLFSYYYLDNKKSEVEIRKKNLLEDLNLKINSDMVRFKQIITNLMDNATKFTVEGYIELGSYKEKDNLVIYIQDTGKGIPSEDIHTVFQQFTKIEDNATTWTQGLGLGLSISQKIATALGGKITVNSILGEGSTFTFYFPMEYVIQSKKVILEEKNKPNPATWNEKTILIAEDVEANYFYLKSALKKSKAKILWAKNGAEAVQEIINNKNIDLILMDIKMPEMDGYQAAKKIKELNPNQIIVAQTAYARPQEKFKFYDESFNEYLAKPIDKDELYKILNKFL